MSMNLIVSVYIENVIKAVIQMYPVRSGVLTSLVIEWIVLLLMGGRLLFEFKIIYSLQHLKLFAKLDTLNT